MVISATALPSEAFSAIKRSVSSASGNDSNAIIWVEFKSDINVVFEYLSAFGQLKVIVKPRLPLPVLHEAFSLNQPLADFDYVLRGLSE